MLLLRMNLVSIYFPCNLFNFLFVNIRPYPSVEVSRTGFIAQEMEGMQKIREDSNLGRKWQFRAEKH